jgi:hypothetical protein
MKRIVFSWMFTLIIFTTGCGGPKYIPDITLTNTGPIIDAIAEFHNLYPAYPLLSGKQTFGLDAPKAERVEPGELTSQVESELLKELDAAGIFSRITRFNQNPDVILSGRITALHEHYRPQTWAKIQDFFPLVGMVTQTLHLKTHVSSGEAHLTLFVLKTTGEVLGTYTGRSIFEETFNPTKEVPPGARLNRALSEAVHQIQDEISHDAKLRKLVSRMN